MYKMPEGNPYRLFNISSPVIRPDIVNSKVLPANAILSVANQNALGLNGLIGTNGLISVAIGPQPLPPGNENGLIGTNGLIGENGLIGTNGLIGEAGLLNPLTPINVQYKTMSLPVGQDANGTQITAELSRKIMLSSAGAYTEQYWYNHIYGTGTNRRFLPVYYLFISDRCSATTASTATFTNAGITYTHPVLFIKQSDKDFYRELWNAEENKKTIFYPTPNINSFPTTGPVATTGFVSY
jgi:hypothetical protein